MKESQFNSYIPYQDKFVIYNAFSNEFLVLEPLLNDLIQASINENDLNGLKLIHEELNVALVNKGFFVKNDEDEIEKVKKLRESVDFNEDIFHLIINPTMNCNFKCWYCYETHIKSSRMDEKNLEKTKKLIFNKVFDNPKIKNFRLSWFGGEPLLYFDTTVLPILKYSFELAKEKKITFSSDFTTNGYLITPKMIESFKEYGVNHFQITLDGNEEKHNKVRFVTKNRGSYREIIENIQKLCSNSIQVAVRINYTKENLEGLEDIIADFEKFSSDERKFMTFSFYKVWQESLDCKDDLEYMTELLLQSNFNVATDYSSDTVRNSCYADRKNHVTLNYNGEIFKCTARDFTGENMEGELTEEGLLDWNEKYEARMNVKFQNKPCLSCNILPICNGGCSQSALENFGKDYCVVEDSGRKKSEIVLAKFLETMQMMPSL